MLIGISGKLGSGKDTVAQMIQYLDEVDEDSIEYAIDRGYLKEDIEAEPSINNTWEIKRFADKLKDTVAMWLGVTREQLENREFKEKPLGKEWWCYKVRDHKSFDYTLKSYLDHNEDNLHRDWLEVHLVKLTPRLIMQLLGTEAGRQIIHTDIWVNATFADYGLRPGYEHRDGITFPEARTAKYPNWIIPDTRFLNEARAIKDRGGVLIKVHRGIDKRFPKLWTEFGYDGNKAMLRNDFYNFVKKKDEELYQKLTHASETSLDSYSDWDYTITNNGTIRTLFEIVKNIYEEIHEKDND